MRPIPPFSRHPDRQHALAPAKCPEIEGQARLILDIRDNTPHPQIASCER